MNRVPSKGPATDAPTREPGLFSRHYLWITIGSCGLVFLGAFESLAVTTIMPVVSADLHGASLYALAFAGPLATGVIGMVVAGNWSDRSGPVLPLYTASALFMAGLLIAGTAGTMAVLVLGRLVQGLGTGAVTVALYVIVARVYPPRLHPSIFAGFAAAWVVPSLIGPVAAGAVTELLSWHWVFLGVVGLVIAATAMVGPALHSLPQRATDEGDRDATGPETARPPWALKRIGWAAAAALCVLMINVLSDIEVVGGLLAGATVILALITVRPLLPRGTLLARRELPSVILLRGLAAAAFFGSEVYLPYLLVNHYRFSPTLAGLALTLGALSWASASWLQGRMRVRLTHVMSTVTGSSLVLGAIVLAFATALFALNPATAIVGWALGGGGMGLMYPRISVMTLAMSTPSNQGFNSSALSIADSLGGALTLATTGIIFAAFSFAGVFVLTGTIAILAVAMAPRVTSAKSSAAQAAVDPG